MTDDFNVDMIDARDTYGVIVLAKDGDENIDMQFKGVTVGRLELAILLMRAGRELKRQHDAEQEES